MNIPRYYNENVGPIEENEKKAFMKAYVIANEIEGVSEVSVIVKDRHAQNFFERVFGKEIVDFIYKGISIEKGKAVFRAHLLDNIREYDDSFRVVLTVGLESEQLFGIDKLPGLQAIIAHQWHKDGVNDWARAWEAENIDTRETAEPIPLPDPVVMKALDGLTRCNLDSSLTNSSDERLCKTYLLALREYHYPLDEKAITAYLVREKKWPKRALMQLTEWIQKANEGKNFQGIRRSEFKGFIEMWEEQTSSQL